MSSLSIHSDESDEGSEFEEMLSRGPTFSQSSQPVVSPSEESKDEQKRPKKPEREEAMPAKKELSEEGKANRIAQCMSISIAKDITSRNELCWARCKYKGKGKNAKHVVMPVRLCHRGEAVGLMDCRDWDGSKRTLVQFLDYCDGRNQRQLLNNSQLTPYRGDDEESSKDADTWCPRRTQEYMKYLENHVRRTNVERLVEQVYLDKILVRVRESEVERAQRKQQEQEEDEQFVDGDGDQEVSSLSDVVAELAPAAAPVANANSGDPDKKEPLRAGDVIQYTDIMAIDGDKYSLRTATIKQVRPRHDYPLLLDCTDLLPKSHRIKRIKRWVRGTLRAYNGYVRSIEDHRLKGSVIGGGASLATVVMKQAQQVNAIVTANKEALFDNLEDIGWNPRAKQNDESSSGEAIVPNVKSSDDKDTDSDYDARKQQAKDMVAVASVHKRKFGVDDSAFHIQCLKNKSNLQLTVNKLSRPIQSQCEVFWMSQDHDACARSVESNER